MSDKGRNHRHRELITTRDVKGPLTDRYASLSLTGMTDDREALVPYAPLYLYNYLGLFSFSELLLSSN